ncbi:uncharacterized protein LOC122643164 [Telopea speciosissima]|uniref:uncharacterized protein LOC122643164 n=1 Tax=Telopea speciosissima TaxID=54955 RepID=UPI001CC620D2|nr:uncharacterized protein LOC122643164 [Telopea speciosissima]
MASYQGLLCLCISFAFVAFAQLLGCNGAVEGRKGFSNKEDSELEMMLKIINKPAKRIIKTEEGDVYGCVDINKQPAFDHPLLKNHTIQVNPMLYKDNLPRTTAFWRVEGSPRTGCYNILCPGFVQVNTKYSLGIPFQHVSVYGGQQYVSQFRLTQDVITGAWWLSLMLDPIGYWPKSIFTSLADSASKVIWGGEVYSPLKRALPQMGSGHFNPKEEHETAFMNAIKVVNKEYKLVPPKDVRYCIVSNTDYREHFVTMASYQGLLSLCISFAFVAFAQLLGCNGAVEGRKGFSNKEDSELEMMLKIINKPAKRIIKTEEGDVYGCVDINKQPAFDHPLLKNHTIQMKPSSFPKGATSFQKTMLDNGSSLIRPIRDSRTNEACSAGTVPIRRIKREDLIRAKLLSERRSRNVSPLSFEPLEYHSALIQTEGKFHGGEATMSINQPKVLGDQYSAALMALESGSTEQTNTIQAGWMVNPMLYKDNLPRTTAFWRVEGSPGTGCYNILCPGFVQVNTKYSLGIPFQHVSVYGGQQYVSQFRLTQDVITGAWWLSLMLDPIGYWPKSIFTSLADSASKVIWGGEVYSPLKRALPQMGSGHFNPKEEHETAFMNAIKVVNKEYKLVPPKDVLVPFDPNPNTLFEWDNELA